MIEQRIKPTLPLIDISIDISSMNETEKQEYVGTLGKKPIVYFNGFHIQENDFNILKIHSFNFAPTIEMNFTDSSGLLEDKSYPLDNSILSVFIDSKSEVYKEIRLDFKILTFDILKRENSPSSYTLTGIINCDYLYTSDSIAYKDMSSYQVIEEIAKVSGLGLVSNINGTNDKMTWINPNLDGSKFIQSIVKSSYIKEDSFAWVYIDLYMNINFIDVESAIEDDVKVDNTLPKTYSIDNKEAETSNLVLTNDDSMKSSNTYFVAMQVLNKSTEQSIKSGYIRRVHMYDISGNWEEKAGEFLIFDLDSINTPGGDDTLVILKSNPTGEEFYKKNINTEFLGKLDKDNVHLDYLFATSQNEHNILNLQKIALKILMPTPNFSLARYQKVQVAFSNQGASITASQINVRLSGEWIIIGIGYECSKKNGNNLDQIVTLVRRELSPDVG